MGTIDSIGANHAILMSSITAQPVHIQGEWFAWHNAVMPKRLLLLVLVFAQSECNIAYAASKVIDYYESVKHKVAANHQIVWSSDAATPKDRIRELWHDIVKFRKKEVEVGNIIFVQRELSTEQLVQYIDQVWGCQHDS